MILEFILESENVLLNNKFWNMLIKFWNLTFYKSMMLIKFQNTSF